MSFCIAINLRPPLRNHLEELGNGAKRTGRAKRRRFDRAVLLFVGLEYALWTASCCWVSDDLRNPYFWFDFALSGGLLLLLPGVREAVEP